MMAEQPMLKVKDLTKRFGGLVALNSVDLEVREGEVYALIGPNGAGKSTLFNCINGLERPTNGRIRFQDRDITPGR